MSKISVRPDVVHSGALRPTSFPITDITKFQVSQTSTHHHNQQRAFPDQSNLRFNSTMQSKKLPNLFQYNDRSKIVFSSDEEDVEHQVSPQKSGHEKVNKVEQDQDLHVEVVSVTRRSRFNSGQNSKQKVSQDEKKKEDEVNDKISKNQLSKKQEKDSNIKIQQVVSQFIVAKSQREKQPSELNQSSKGERESTIRIENEHNIPQVLQIQEKYSPVDITKKQEPLNLKEPSNLSEKRIDLNQSQLSSATPTKRKRNKIFDQSSSKRRKNLFVELQKETASNGIQTEDVKLKDSLTYSTGKNQTPVITPEVKALNILDKLVDQIGSNKQPLAFQSMDGDTKKKDFIFKALAEFNQFCLDEIARLESMDHLSLLLKREFYISLQKLCQQVAEWKQKIGQQIFQISFSNTIYYEIIKKFQKVSETVQIYSRMSISYRQTNQRLQMIQQKLEEYVTILHNKDAKGLYRLAGDLKLQIERMKHLRAGCGKLKVEKMFSEYLTGQIEQLEEINADIDGNFIEDFPQLQF